MRENTSDKNKKENGEELADFLCPSSDKVIALYHAVINLFMEGADAAQLKVSDIAFRAGVGKGTTYAYFKSREELIVKAMLYDIYKRMENVEQQIQKANGFQNKVNKMLDAIFEANPSDKRFFKKVVPFFCDLGTFPARFCEEFQKYAFYVKDREKIGNLLFQSAAEEGIADKDLDLFYVRTALFDMLISYAFYKKSCDCEEVARVSKEQIRKRLYENLVFSLRK